MLTVTLTEIIEHVKDIEDPKTFQYYIGELTQLKNKQDPDPNTDTISLAERLDLNSVNDKAMRLVSKCMLRNISDNNGDPYYNLVFELLESKRYAPANDLSERTRSELMSGASDYDNALRVALQAHTRDLKHLRHLKKTCLVDENLLTGAYCYKIAMDVIKQGWFDYSNTTYPLSYVAEHLFENDSFTAHLYQNHAIRLHGAVYQLMRDSNLPISINENVIPVMRLISYNWDSLTDSQKINYTEKVIMYASEGVADEYESTLEFFTPESTAGHVFFKNLHGLHALGVDLQKPGLVATLLTKDNEPSHELPELNA